MNRAERGAALVEFALVLPLLLVVIAGIVDFGFVFQRYEVVTNAAREGARLGSLPGYGPTSVENRVRSYVQEGLSLSSGALTTVLPTSPNAVTADYTQTIQVLQPDGSFRAVPAVTVTVAYHHNFLLLGPMLGLINKSWGGSIILTSSSQMRLEQ